MQLVVSQNLRDASVVLDALLKDLAPWPPAESNDDSNQIRLWNRLRDDGWLEVGGHADHPDRPHLRDLVEIGEVWGRHLGSLPFVESMLVARWVVDDSPFSGSPVTIALPGHSESVLVPFGARPGVRCVSIASSGEATTTEGLVTESLDSFTPSLPLAQMHGTSPLSGELLDEAMALYAAEAVGAASVALEMALGHARQREAYGQPIGKFQAVRHRLANMHRDLEIARTAAVWAAQSDGQSVRAGLAGAQLARQVAEGAMQVFGGMSYTWDLGLHYYLRHILVIQKLTRAAANSKDMRPALLD